MSLKIVDATEIKVGTSIVVEGAPCTVKSIDISKTGKHGHSKARIEAVGIIDDNKKKILVLPGHERLEVPMIDKRKGQVLSVGDKVSIMDMESFETLEVDCPAEIKEQLTGEANVEYWDIEGIKIIKRKI